MHVPDGFLSAPASAATAAVAIAGVAIALRRSRDELDERTTPLAGLVATFIFATQMLNFPVAAGTSGHLLGGALAAVLVGPWTATLCITVVLLVQALILADGGLTALGTNITLMGIIGVWVGYAVFCAARRVLPARLSSIPVAAGIGAFVSVPAAAGMFALMYAAFGATSVPLATILTAMVGTHVLIGIGEAIITFLIVSSIVAVRADLVYGARTVRLAPASPSGSAIYSSAQTDRSTR